MAKGVCRLDHLRSGNRDVVESFIYSTLLSIVLSLPLCEWLRSKYPSYEFSLWRVTSLMVEWLPDLIGSIGRSDYWLTLLAFEKALLREGRNPNPGRPYTSKKYTFTLGWLDAIKAEPVNG